MGRGPLARPTDAPPSAHAATAVTSEVVPVSGLSDTPQAVPSREPVTSDADGRQDADPDAAVPRHVAIIMDGNRRWARSRGLPELEGHAAGVEAIRSLLRHAVRRSVAVLTLYAFSRENWARDDDEVHGLFSLLEGAIRSETAELSEQGVRIRLLGRLDELPDETRRSIGAALAETEEGSRLQLNIAFNYAGRTEIVDAVRRLIADGTRPEEVDEAAIAAALYTSGLPDPDLIIRTGGEHRLSNFLIWQSAYAELYTTEVLWPDFDADAFDEALVEFARRARRFGR